MELIKKEHFYPTCKTLNYRFHYYYDRLGRYHLHGYYEQFYSVYDANENNAYFKSFYKHGRLVGFGLCDSESI